MTFLEQNTNHTARVLLGLNDNNPNYTEGLRGSIASYYRTYLNDLEKSIMEGDIFISPDKDRIDSEIWEKCKLLSGNGFVIGGSVVLNLYGFIDREIGDIDVFLGSGEVNFTLEDHPKVETEENDENYDPEDRIKVNVGNIGIMDVFNYRVDYYVYDGVKINSPFTALKAKIKYKRLKDINDFVYMVKRV